MDGWMDGGWREGEWMDQWINRLMEVRRGEQGEGRRKKLAGRKQSTN